MQIVKEFQLYNRILHVFSEAQQVYDFRDACDLPSNTEAFLKIGQLMNESHFSCKDMYECSCDELDELTSICRKFGAYGSRLTGAGWGGCAVSLIPKESLRAFLSNVGEHYYSKNQSLQVAFSRSAFATEPSEGIFVVTK